MQSFFKCKCLVVLPLCMLLTACGDETEKPAQSARADSAPNAVQVVAYSGVAACDAYFSAMRACVTPEFSSEEREKLELALNALGEKMNGLEDKASMEKACESALKEIDWHKKEIGCSV